MFCDIYTKIIILIIVIMIVTIAIIILIMVMIVVMIILIIIKIIERQSKIIKVIIMVMVLIKAVIRFIIIITKVIIILIWYDNTNRDTNDNYRIISRVVIKSKNNISATNNGKKKRNCLSYRVSAYLLKYFFRIVFMAIINSEGRP